MKLLVKIAWKNIWRNRIRSFVILTAIAIGLIGGLFASGLGNGLIIQRVTDFLQTELSHVQIHHQDYVQDPQVFYTIPNANEVVSELVSKEGVQAVSGKTLAEGLIGTSAKNVGVNIVGVIPERERQVTDIHLKLIEGVYLDSAMKRNPILIGKDLADDLKAKTGSKVVLSFQGMNNELVSAAFRVCGIFKTSDKSLNQGKVFVERDKLQELIGGTAIHQISIVLEDRSIAPAFAADLDGTWEELTVRDWQLISPELAYLSDYSGVTLYIYLGIILFGLAFGVLNTMLMAVLERTREIGMLMAVGMSRARVFGMIVLETVFLSMIGAATGITGGIILTEIFKQNGLNLEAFAEGLNSMGMSEVIYPYLGFSDYFNTVIMVFTVAVLAAIYPSIKALRLNPSEALSTL